MWFMQKSFNEQWLLGREEDTGTRNAESFYENSFFYSVYLLQESFKLM